MKDVTDENERTCNAKNEVLVLNQKLESKQQALLIMSKELKKITAERDQFKLMAEQVQERYQALRRALALGDTNNYNTGNRESRATIQKLNTMLHESREANNVLQRQLEISHIKSMESKGDIKLLREQLAREKFTNQQFSASTSLSASADVNDLIVKLESALDKVSQLERDLALCLDEKEEFIIFNNLHHNKDDRSQSVRRKSEAVQTSIKSVRTLSRSDDSREKENTDVKSRFLTFLLNSYEVDWKAEEMELLLLKDNQSYSRLQYLGRYLYNSAFRCYQQLCRSRSLLCDSISRLLNANSIPFDETYSHTVPDLYDCIEELQTLMETLEEFAGMKMMGTETACPNSDSLLAILTFGAEAL